MQKSVTERGLQFCNIHRVGDIVQKGSYFCYSSDFSHHLVRVKLTSKDRAGLLKKLILTAVDKLLLHQTTPQTIADTTTESKRATFPLFRKISTAPTYISVQKPASAVEEMYSTSTPSMDMQLSHSDALSHSHRPDIFSPESRHTLHVNKINPTITTSSSENHVAHMLQRGRSS
ncbi:hypothetical protein CRENBAI_026541 [Crenichthys baileyi]|uniref:Uncharacterized protein n=1 Tax=Crenichthys baileyi TaxID=28760 RepID=A0AAV9R8I5_9TELE